MQNCFSFYFHLLFGASMPRMLALQLTQFVAATREPPFRRKQVSLKAGLHLLSERGSACLMSRVPSPLSQMLLSSCPGPWLLTERPPAPPLTLPNRSNRASFRVP